MQSIVQIDAFTDVPFRGNPAGVCLLENHQDEAWMQNVAREMNLSETAFLRPRDDGFSLRWFTPTAEVELCGHATLASAHFLFEEKILAHDETAFFHTLSGVLTARQHGDLIELDFPSKPDSPADPPPGLIEALGVAPVYVGRSEWDYVVEVANDDEVGGAAPNMTALKKVDARGVIVTARSSRPEFDFVSRFFAPGVGVDEDPVTGSAHCCLAPFWSSRLGKTRFRAYQASARGGVLEVTLDGERVRLGGRAVTVLRGTLLC
jgi:phenazine biosynthesis protein PhzF family